MKQISLPVLVVLLFPWLACNHQTANDAASTIANSPSPVSTAEMIIPPSKDTVLASGRKNIYLFGRRNLPGFYIERSVFPAGYKGMPHVHNSDLYVTIINGSAHMVFGKQFDTTAGHHYGPGSFMIIKKDQPHYEWFTESCTMQIEGIGPQETFYLSDSTKGK
jgi:hypothetical protein